MTPAEPEPPLLAPFLSMSGRTEREAALDAAFRLHEMVGGLRVQRGVARAETVAEAEDAVRATADLFAAWIEGPIELLMIPGPVVDEQTGLPTDTQQKGTDTMQMNTGQAFTFTLKGRDRSGYITTIPDVEVTTDNPAVAILARDPEVPGKWRVGSGEPGESVLTAELPPLTEGGEPRTARLVVDVIPGDAVAIEFEIGEVVEEE